MYRHTATLFLPLALLLAACATPRQSCISDAQAPLRSVTRDIAVTERNLARGYRLVTVRDTELALTQCIRRRRDGAEVTYPCQRPVVVRRSEPIAIDFSEERARLRALQSRRAALQRSTSDRIRQCQAAFPVES